MLKVKTSDPCPKCNKCFSDKKNLENHIKNNVCRWQTQKKCNRCGHVFLNAGGTKGSFAPQLFLKKLKVSFSNEKCVD